jgi:aspartyl-tRNA(Asn)/glutamyl-tRNA(Gln) amidotransferase subunit A
VAELHWMPAHELAAMIRRRELKPSELMTATIARIEQLNSKFNAFCALRPDLAMAEARAMDDRIARGDDVGPLAGLPLGVKDLEGVTGMATTFGSVPFKHNLAHEDAIEVARLRAAGAIVIGKTNTPEFGFTAFTQSAFRCLAQSMESGSHARWIFRRKLGGDRVGDGAVGDRIGLGRLD